MVGGKKLRFIEIAVFAVCLATSLLSTAYGACQVGCTCGDPNCNCGETGQCGPSSPPNEQGTDPNSGITITFTPSGESSWTPQIGVTVGKGTPQSSAPTNDPALTAISNQIDNEKKKINDKYSAYQQGLITRAEWWEFVGEEEGSAQWIMGQWAAIVRLLGELSADKPIPETAWPNTEASPHGVNTGAGNGIGTNIPETHIPHSTLQGY